MRELFSRVAPRYDFITRAFSYGMDAEWKRLAVDGARLPEAAVVLDLACGTGDFSRLIKRRIGGSRLVALDLTEPMLRRAARHGAPVCGDASALPFPDACFDAVLVGYGLRNFPALEAALAEIRRVLRPGGVLVSLDFFLPPNRLWRRLYLGCLYLQGFFWGLLLHARPRTYTYIADSLRCFLTMDEYAALLERAGLRVAASRGFLGGGIGLHWAAVALAGRAS